MKNKKKLLVTLADENYIDQAKQLFSSVYWDAGWKGDYMLLAHEIPEKKLKWFRDKGILVKKCKPIEKLYENVKLSKFYLFTPEFKKWNNIVYLDADIIVRASLDNLTKVRGFAAVLDDLVVKKLIDQFLSPHQIDKKTFDMFKKNYNIKSSAFNSGVMAFSTDVIKKDTFSKLINLSKQHTKLTKPGNLDQPILNLLFYKKWKELPIIYNLDMRDFKFINPKKIKAIVIHFSGGYKPWYHQNLFYGEWKSNLEKAELINLKEILAIYDFKNSEIKYYSKHLKRRFFRNFQNLTRFIDYQIGSIGIFLYDRFPKLYFKLNSLKKQDLLEKKYLLISYIA